MVVNTTPFEPSERGIWLYSHLYPSGFTQEMIDCGFYPKKVNTVYLSATLTSWQDPVKGPQLTNWVAYARSKGIRVFSSTLEDPSFTVANEATLRSWFGGMIQGTKNIFDTYVIDVEPHTINLVYGTDFSDYETNKAFYFNKYVEMSAILRTIADEEGVRYVDTVPWWYHEQWIAEGITGGLNNVSSHAMTLMSYSNTIEAIVINTRKVREEVGTLDNKRLLIAFNIVPGMTLDPAIPKPNIIHALNILKSINMPMAYYMADQVEFFDEEHHYFQDPEEG